MKMVSLLVTRALDVFDVVFDAIAALYRVLLRAAFAPDAKAYRGARFAPLSASDVLLQEIALNAADAAEAKKAVALNADDLLPLAADVIAFDIAGPLASHGRPRSRPERAFVLGVVRKDALIKARADLPALRRGGVEAFVFIPPSQPQCVLVFKDETGRKGRRLRRAATAIAALVCMFAGANALDAGQSALNRATAAADADRLQIERRIRLAERRTSTAEAALARAGQVRSIPIGEAAQKLALLALHQPAETETIAATLQAGVISVRGQSYDADAAELQWRRTFEREVIVFNASPGAAPNTFEARIALRAEPAP